MSITTTEWIDEPLMISKRPHPNTLLEPLRNYYDAMVQQNKARLIKWFEDGDYIHNPERYPERDREYVRNAQE